MTSQDQQDYARLQDRQLLGAALTQQEHDLLAVLEERDPHCAFEGALVGELSDVAEHGPLASDPAALVDRVLAAVEQGALERDAEPVLADLVAADMADMADAPDEHLATAAPQTRTSGSRTLWIVGAFAAAAAIALTVVNLGSAPHDNTLTQTPHLTRAELVHVTGDATLNGKVARVGGPALQEGSRLEVNSGSACIAIDPGIDVCLGAGAAVRLRSLDHNRQVEVLRGSVIASLDKQPLGESFSLAAQNTTLRAIGTVFAISVSDTVEATVIEGQIAVEHAASETLLNAHQRAVVSDRIEVHATTRADESRWRSMLPDAMPWRERDVAILVVAGEPANAAVFLDGAKIGQTPLSTMVGPGQHDLRVEADHYASLVRHMNLQPAETETVRIELQPAPQIEPTPEPKPAKPVARPPTPSAEALLTQARGRLVKRDYRGAAQAYSRLVRAHPRSPEAHAVLVSLGDLQLRRLSNPRGASRSYARYLREGGGPLAQEARLGKIASKKALHDTTGERSAIEAFLQRHPTSANAGKLRIRLEALRK